MSDETTTTKPRNKPPRKHLQRTFLEQCMADLSDRERALWSWLMTGKGEAAVRKLFNIE